MNTDFKYGVGFLLLLMAFTIAGAFYDTSLRAGANALTTCSTTCNGRVAEFSYTSDELVCVCDGAPFEDRE
jgi:hypothetical protein